MKQLQSLVDLRELAPVDVELGALLMRRATPMLADVDEARVVAMTGALLSSERARGHSCLDLAAVAGRAPWAAAPELRLPDAARWRAILERSRLCGEGGAVAPLVLDGERLYLHRFHQAERRLAAAVRARVASASPGTPDAETVALFRRLFPAARGGEVDWQAVAAAAAMRGRLTVITGGPGTGKTTTVARILALLLHQDPTLRVAVAAPTGKAAARLAESIAASAATLPVDEHLRDRLPREGRTLHRLLGYRPWDDAFAHGAECPLAEGAIVVDEASMVDVLMMDALLAAVRSSARVILLGDQDQLASVETGYVLGDLCAAAEAGGDLHGAALARWYDALSGAPLPSSPAVTPLRDAVV
ncbi:MAG TPA: AAA family ATPase, partial [Gemmatimonadaceae bacterium]|nr:AAA family ATPase [Gemmatimonadaceae bacterium]